MIQLASEDLRTDEAKRLSEARRARGFEDAKAAASYFGWNYTTYSQHERGERGLKKAVAEKYAKAFRISAGWLTTGEGGRETSFTAPVMGFVGAGAEINVGIEQVPPGGFYDIDTIIPLPADVVAFEVVGDSMYPRYDPGDVIVCYEKSLSIPEMADGTYAAVLLDDDRRFLKKVRREPGGTFTLESHNAPAIYGVRITWAADVLATIPATRWSKVTNGHRKPRLKAGA